MLVWIRKLHQMQLEGGDLVIRVELMLQCWMLHMLWLCGFRMEIWTIQLRHLLSVTFSVTNSEDVFFSFA